MWLQAWNKNMEQAREWRRRPGWFQRVFRLTAPCLRHLTITVWAEHSLSVPDIKSRSMIWIFPSRTTQTSLSRGLDRPAETGRQLINKSIIPLILSNWITRPARENNRYLGEQWAVRGSNSLTIIIPVREEEAGGPWALVTSWSRTSSRRQPRSSTPPRMRSGDLASRSPSRLTGSSPVEEEEKEKEGKGVWLILVTLSCPHWSLWWWRCQVTGGDL